jgi:hemoglobin
MTRMHPVAMIAVMVAAACGGKATPPEPAPAASLYDRLGKKDAITLVVKDFVEERVAKDSRINLFFKTTDIPDLEAKLVDQLCEASGGPCKYTGKDMKISHAGLGIKDADFNAMVEDLQVTLDKFKVGAREQQELLGALAPMHDDIVTAK